MLQQKETTPHPTNNKKVRRCNKNKRYYIILTKSQLQDIINEGKYAYIIEFKENRKQEFKDIELDMVERLQSNGK